MRANRYNGKWKPVNSEWAQAQPDIGNTLESDIGYTSNHSEFEIRYSQLPLRACAPEVHYIG